jgi:signal transduction histidine kinase
VITSALARSFGAVNAVSLALAIPILIEYSATRGILSTLPVTLTILIVLVGSAAAMGVRPNRWSLGVFLTLGSVGAVAFQIILIDASPGILEEGLYLLNRPAVALVMVGVTASTVRAGVVWALVGFALSHAVTLAVTVLAGVPFTPGFGPVLTLTLVLVCYLALGMIQVSLRRRVPDFDQLEQQTRLATLSEDLRMKVTAAVHDTLLNDLSLVMNAPAALDDRMRDRLREDVRTLTSADWLRASSKVVIDDQDADLRNRIVQLINDFQWRGLTVHVTGSGTGVYRLAAGVPDTIIEVVRACLENVLQHSGTAVAEIDLAYSATEVTIVVTDQGAGFDPATVPADRLGLRDSIVERIRTAGGVTRVWSTPGAGTSIVMTVPVTPVTENEGSRRVEP